MMPGARGGGGGGARGGGGSGMGRSSGSARHSGKTASEQKSPKSVDQSPAQVPVQAGNGPPAGGLGAAVADGMAFGGGSAVAHRAADAVMGPRVIQHEIVASEAPQTAPAALSNAPVDSDACGDHFKALQDCLNSNPDINQCQFYMDMLKECRGSGAALSA